MDEYPDEDDTSIAVRRWPIPEPSPDERLAEIRARADDAYYLAMPWETAVNDVRYLLSLLAAATSEPLGDALGASTVRQYGSHAEAVRSEMAARTPAPVVTHRDAE